MLKPALITFALAIVVILIGAATHVTAIRDIGIAPLLLALALLVLARNEISQRNDEHMRRRGGGS